MELALATTAVKLVLGKLGDLAVDKVFELYGVSDEVELMRMELNLIEGFLADVDPNPNNESHAVENWLKELRRVAENIDKVITTFENEIPKGRVKGMVKKPGKLNNISADIGQNTKILEKLYQRGTQLGITPRAIAPANKLLEVDDPEVVGFDSARRQIISHLLDKSISRRTVLSIAGVGGLGKTTLAKKVYNSSELKDRFDCRAWQAISQTFNENDILRNILYSIKPEMKSRNPANEELETEVKSCLRDKSYLIILDDVWSTDLWDGLKNALLDGKKSSRVIITTREADVARAADRNTKVCQLDFLKEDESVALLFRKALQRPDIQPQDYPPSLKDIAQKLVKKCGGLPLALVVLGGILSTREDTFPAWKMVFDTLDWHDGQAHKKCMEILAKSYEALPNNHLKRCFLYFAAFPEDYEISAKLVTKLWVAEELILESGAGTLEDQAEKYLQDLVKRCLVQVTQKSRNGNCKYCRMHDLIRELAIMKSKKENFFTVFSRNKEIGGKQDELSRRVALQSCSPTDCEIHDTKDILSLIYFGERMDWDWMYSNDFKQLRVLVFEGFGGFAEGSREPFLKNLFESLVHLKYLGIRNRGFHEVVILRNVSFSGLTSLETLDCQGTAITVNPSLWEILTLRHVIGSPLYDCPLNWSRLKNLQTVKVASLKDFPVVECNDNLRVLKFFFGQASAVDERLQRLKALLSRAKHLVSLTIDTEYEVPFLSIGTHGLPCHETIQALHLSGKWAAKLCDPSVEIFPKNLTKLTLKTSKLEEDPMPILGKLLSLMILHLDDSYTGSKMVCLDPGFPSLKKLEIEYLKNLREWEIRAGAMPVLAQLKISMCWELQQLPELNNVPSLQELYLKGLSDELFGRLKTEDGYKIDQIPSVIII